MADWGRVDRGSGAPIAAPDEAMPQIFTYLRVRVQEFSLEIIESAVVQVKLSLERLIGHTLTLAEEGQDLIEDCVEVHPISSSSCPEVATAPAMHLIAACTLPSRGSQFWPLCQANICPSSKIGLRLLLAHCCLGLGTLYIE